MHIEKNPYFLMPIASLRWHYPDQVLRVAELKPGSQWATPSDEFSLLHGHRMSRTKKPLRRRTINCRYLPCPAYTVGPIIFALT